jgi:serine/threonine protein kinase
MSPEQALGKAVDGRTDVFSLGVVLYEMATGRRPFGGETITETMTQIIRDEPAEPVQVNPGISPAMNEIIRRSLRKNMDERYTAAELVTALDAQQGRARTAPYTSENALTAAVTAPSAAPTVNTGSQVKTVLDAQAPPPPPRSGKMGMIAAIVIFLLLAGAATAYWFSHRGEPVNSIASSTPAAPASQPASTTSVAVTAPPPTIVETPPTTTSEPAVTELTATATKAETRPTLGTVSLAATQPTATQSRVEPPPPPAPASLNVDSEAGTPATRSPADTLFQTALAELRSGDAQQARKTLHQVLLQDPHYAQAHLQMGQIALFNRNFNYAAEELDRAMMDSERLNFRQQQITRISLAITRHDRQAISRLDMEISERWPNDPTLARMHDVFPGMFEDSERDFGRRRRH